MPGTGIAECGKRSVWTDKGLLVDLSQGKPRKIVLALAATKEPACLFCLCSVGGEEGRLVLGVLPGGAEGCHCPSQPLPGCELDNFSLRRFYLLNSGTHQQAQGF